MVCNQIIIGNFRPTCLVHLDSVNSLRRVLFVFPYYTSTTVQCCQASGFAPSIFSSKTRGKNANQPLLLTARFGFSPLVSVNAKAYHYKALTTYIRFYLKDFIHIKKRFQSKLLQGVQKFQWLAKLDSLKVLKSTDYLKTWLLFSLGFRFFSEPINFKVEVSKKATKFCEISHFFKNY